MLTLRLFFLFIYFFHTLQSLPSWKKIQLILRRSNYWHSNRVELRSFNTASSALQSRLLSIVGEREKSIKRNSIEISVNCLTSLASLLFLWFFCYCQCTFHLPSLAPLPKSCPIDSSIAICYNSKEIYLFPRKAFFFWLFQLNSSFCLCVISRKCQQPMLEQSQIKQIALFLLWNKHTKRGIQPAIILAKNSAQKYFWQLWNAQHVAHRTRHSVVTIL